MLDISASRPAQRIGSYVSQADRGKIECTVSSYREENVNTISIDAKKCKKDGLCIAECPLSLFSEGTDGVPVVVEGGVDVCINCGHCVTICPGAAITVNGISALDCEQLDRELTVSADQAIQLFKSRRSIRSYKGEAVARETLETLLDMARWAPTARNVQPVNWIVIEKQEEVARLSSMVIDRLQEKNLLPDIVTAHLAGQDMINRGAPCLVIAHASSEGFKPAVDCSIALTSIEAAAGAFGLGACWAGFFMSAATEYQPILDYLDLPQGHNVYGALMLGYPKVRYYRIPPREPAKVTWR